MNVLVTGFGAFGPFVENPSAALAASCGLPHRILPVTFGEVEAFVAEREPGFDMLVMLGVASKETDPRLRLELVARNRIGASPDAAGTVGGPGPVDPFAPPQLGSTLFRGDPSLSSDGHPMWRPSVDAGPYLCNYALFRALQAWPERRVGFVHVPPADTWPLGEQTAALAELLNVLTEDH